MGPSEGDMMRCWIPKGVYSNAFRDSGIRQRVKRAGIRRMEADNTDSR